MKKIILFLFAFTVLLFASTENTNPSQKIDTLEKPLYTPFVENYILHEIKQLREENRDLKVDLHKTLAEKEVDISNNAIDYATSTINNMFYILAAATSLLVIIGWSSIRDINGKIENIIDNRVSSVINEYESRMHAVEKDLQKRSKQVLQNQKDIEETNLIHSLWMRASQEMTLNGKIEIYDEILTIRPDDVEALVYKSDAVLDIGEANWALNLTNQALTVADSYASAYYQRAKVYSVLGFLDNAVEDLEKAVSLNEQYVLEVEDEDEFKGLLSNEKVQELLNGVDKLTSSA